MEDIKNIIENYTKRVKDETLAKTKERLVRGITNTNLMKHFEDPEMFTEITNVIETVAGIIEAMREEITQEDGSC